MSPPTRAAVGRRSKGCVAPSSSKGTRERRPAVPRAESKMAEEPPPNSSKEPISAPYWPYPLAFLALLVLGHGLGEVADIERLTDSGTLDYRVHSWVVRHRDDYPRLTRFARAVTRLGNPWIATSAVFAIALTLHMLY